MSLRLRVAKLYQRVDAEGAWPRANSGDRATSAAIMFAGLLIMFIIFCAGMCE
jgi:hypothetical protein